MNWQPPRTEAPLCLSGLRSKPSQRVGQSKLSVIRSQTDNHTTLSNETPAQPRSARQRHFVNGWQPAFEDCCNHQDDLKSHGNHSRNAFKRPFVDLAASVKPGSFLSFAALWSKVRSDPPLAYSSITPPRPSPSAPA